MPFWLLAVLFIGSIIAGELLRPKPRDTSKPATLSDFNFPTADESRPIPVAWGTVKIDGPNILWYGDLQQVQLTRSIKSGFFSSTKSTLGFRYSFGVDYALCWGQVNSIAEIRTDNKLAWNAGGFYDPTNPSTLSSAVQDVGGGGQEFVVDARTIYGGDADFQIEAGGTGGVYAVCTFYSGHPNTSINSYLSNVLAPAPVPAYNNISRLVWQGPSNGRFVLNGNFVNEPFKSGYMGISQNLNTIEFIVVRTPNLLSKTTGDKWYYVKTYNTISDALARVATTSNISLNGLQTIDGVSLVNGDIVLVKNQINQKENGLYICNGSGSWNRTDDELVTEFSIAVNEGNTYRDTRFLIASADVIIGTSDIVFTQDTSFSLVAKGDANPADCLYELLTSSLWGLKIPENLIDFDSFKQAQKILFANGLGFSAIWDTPKEAIDVINELLNYMDGVLYADLKTGLITLKLARDDYKVNNLILFDQSNAEITSYSRAAWAETTNEVRVNYLERKVQGSTIGSLGTTFKEKPAIVQDLANFRIQDSIVSTNIDYVGLSNATTASRLAYRDLRILSTPLIKVSIETSRKGSELRPGDLFRLDWDDFNIKIKNQVFRVLKIRYGTLGNDVVEIDAIEDVFSIHNSIYSAASTNYWEDPSDQDPASIGEVYIQEVPYYYSGDSRKLQFFVEKPGNNQNTFNVYTGIGPAIGDLSITQSGQPFTPMGRLNTAIPRFFGSIDSSTYEVIGLDSPSPNAIPLSVIRSVETSDVKNGFNLALLKSNVSEEIIGFENASYIDLSETLEISNIYRGLLDTTPQEHPIDTIVYFFTYGDAIPDVTFNTATGYSALQPVGQTGPGNISSVYSKVFNDRAKRPYPPADIRLNGLAGDITIGTGSSIPISWSNTNRLRQAFNIYFQNNVSFPPESGTEVYIDVYNQSNIKIATKGPIPARIGSYTYSNSAQIADNGGSEPTAITLHIYTKREGLYSYQAQVRKIVRSGAISSIPQYTIPTDSYFPNPDGNATYLNGIPLEGNPSNGQVLVYNSSSGTWQPANQTGGNLGGDVTGLAASNTVERIRNISVSTNNPNDQEVLTYSSLLNSWGPEAAAYGKTYTKKGTGLTTIAPSGSWTDINTLNISFEPLFIANAYCECTLKLRPINYTATNKVQLKFNLNGYLDSEVWIDSNNTNPTLANDEYKLISFHTVFRNLTAGATNVVSVQINDGLSGQVYEITERRLTVITTKSEYNSTFVPSELSPAYWFDANRIVGLIGGNKLPQMTDFSGFNRHFTQAISGNRAVWQPNVILNNAAVIFDHTQQQYYSGPNFMTGFTSGELYIVMKSSFDPPADGISTGYMQVGSNAQAVHFPYLTGDAYDNWGSTTRHVFNTTIPFNQWNLYNVLSTNGAWVAYFNGELLHFDTSNVVGFSSSPKIGASNAGAFFSGYIAEILFFNRLLTNIEAEKLNNYFNLRYNV